VVRQLFVLLLWVPVVVQLRVFQRQPVVWSSLQHGGMHLMWLLLKILQLGWLLLVVEVLFHL